MTRSITFPKITAAEAGTVHATYRNTETGVEIQRRIAGGVWTVIVPRQDGYSYVARTLAEARVLAADAAREMRIRIAADRDLAYAEDAQREMDEAAAYQATPQYRRFAEVTRTAGGYTNGLDVDHAEALAEDDNRGMREVMQAWTERLAAKDDTLESALEEDSRRDVADPELAAVMTAVMVSDRQIDAWRERHADTPIDARLRPGTWILDSYLAVDHEEAIAEDAERAATECIADGSTQVQAWFDWHAALGTDVSRDAYPTIAYRRADHEEALRDDARYNRAVTLDAAAYRRGVEDVVAAVDASPGIYAVHVRRAVDAADAAQEGVTQATAWLDRHGIDSATHDAVRAATDVDHAAALAWEQQYSEHGRGPAVKFDYNPGTEFVTHHDIPAEEEDTMTDRRSRRNQMNDLLPKLYAEAAHEAIARRNQRPDLYDRAAARTGNTAHAAGIDSLFDAAAATARRFRAERDAADDLPANGVRYFVGQRAAAGKTDPAVTYEPGDAFVTHADMPDPATPTYRNDYPTTPLAPAVGSVQARLNGTVMADSVQAYLDAETRPGRAQRVGPVSVRYCHAIYDGISHAISYTDADTGAEEILQLTASTSVAQTAQLMQAVA